MACRRPAALDRRADYASVWREPGLVLSQTCGYPYATAAARPRAAGGDAGLPGGRLRRCAATARCCVVRADDPAETLADLRGRRVAFNATDSQSGHNALRAAVAPLAPRRALLRGHASSPARTAASADAVAAGEADLCAIDCVTWAMLGRHEPERVAGLRVIGRTASAPGLPLITGPARPLAAVRAAVAAVMAMPGARRRRARRCCSTGSRSWRTADYDAILAMERRAAALGYPALA